MKVVDGKVAEVTDISWMPEPGNFRRGNRMPLLRTVPGRNYSYEETVAIAGGKPILSHGAFYITPEMYQAAVRQKAALESGTIAYKMLDGRSGDGAINCIHAVTGVVGRLNTGTRRGETATSAVVSFFLSTGHMSSSPFGSASRGAATGSPGATSAVTPPAASSPSGTHGPSAAPQARAAAPARFFSADTSTRYEPISASTVAVGGSAVPPGSVRPLGWRLGLSGEIIWVYRSESDFPVGGR